MKFLHPLKPRGWMSALEAGLLLVVPLVFYRGLAEQFSYPKAFLTRVLIILGLGVWALGMVWSKRTWPRRFCLGLPLALLAAAVLLSCLNSPVPIFSLHEAEYFLCGPAWVLLLVSWERGEAAVRRVAILVTIAGTVVAVIALLQWVGYDPLLFGGYSVHWGKMVARMRLYSTLGNPNFVAGYLIGTAFAALPLTRIASTVPGRAAGCVAAVLMLGAIIGTGSRGAWAGLLAGLLLTAFLWVGASRKSAGVQPASGHEKGSAARTTGLLIPVGIWLLALPTGKLLEALLGSFEGRIYLWRVSWPMFAEHPMLGGGYATFQLRFLDLQARFLAAHPDAVRYWSNIRQLHNDPLQLLLETGLLGLLAFAWVLWTYGRGLREAVGSVPRSRCLWLAASAGGVTAILVDSFFNFQFFVPPTFLLLFTFIAFPTLIENESVAVQGTSAGTSSLVDSQRPSDSNGLGRSEANRKPRRPWVFRLLASLAILVCAGTLVRDSARQATAERDYALALAYESRGNMAGAEQVYRRGLALNPLNGRLHFGLARVLYLTNRFPAALVEVVLAERTYADSHLAVLKARIQDQMGLGTAALATYRHALALDPTLKTVQADIARLSQQR